MIVFLYIPITSRKNKLIVKKIKIHNFLLNFLFKLYIYVASEIGSLMIFCNPNAGYYEYMFYEVNHIYNIEELVYNLA